MKVSKSFISILFITIVLPFASFMSAAVESLVDREAKKLIEYRVIKRELLNKYPEDTYCVIVGRIEQLYYKDEIRFNYQDRGRYNFDLQVCRTEINKYLYETEDMPNTIGGK